MYFSGRVHSVVYEEPAKAFYILKMILDSKNEDENETLSKYSGEQVTAKGYVPGPTLQVGSWFCFEANWTTHKEFGKQLNIKQAPLQPKDGWTQGSVAKALNANGVGYHIIELLKFAHGADLPTVLNDVEKLKETAGLDELTAVFVSQRWQRIQGYYKGLDFLLKLNLPAGVIRKVWATFGEDVITILGSNPWQLVKVEGVTFPQCDEIATKMGLDMKHPGRLEAAVLSVVSGQKSFGHLYMTASRMYLGVQALVPEVTQEEFGAGLVACRKAGGLVVERSVRKGTTAVYDPWSAQIEDEGASRLLARHREAAFASGAVDPLPYIKQLAQVGPKTAAEVAHGSALGVVVRAAVDDWQSGENLALSDNQKQGVINALCEPVSILTGLPGTGKTTSLRAAVRILQESGVKFLLCAPTGIAAKNLGKLTNAPASTIHRAFAAKGRDDEKREATYTGVVGDSENAITTEKEELWGYGPNNPYPAEVVFVDEASMLDQHLLYRLLICTGPQTRLVFIGDAAQLPSVGPGNVLRDLIKSLRFPTVNLIEIFRQKDTSAIVYAAHAIYKGEMPECEPPSDFSLIAVQSEDKVQEIITKLAEKLFARRANFQILSPRHAGQVGVTKLNSLLRDLLNPANNSLREIRIGEDTVREDDRIMVIRNDYKLGIFNGDVGKVASIDNKSKELELKIFGDTNISVTVPFKQAASTIRLAYACTVHKAQGLEYDVIVMPVVESFGHQLQRNLFYTAVTRARHKVFLVGSYRALSMAVGNDREDMRNTLLRDRLLLKTSDIAPTE